MTGFQIKIFLFLLTLAFSSSRSSGQVEIALGINDTDKVIESNGIPITSESFGDTLAVLQYIHEIRQELISVGYLTASFDSTYWHGDTLYATLTAGKKFLWARLSPGNVPEEYLTRTGYREKLYREKPFYGPAVGTLFSRLLDHMDRIGYPFAELKLDSISIYDNSMRARLDLKRNQFVVIDSLIIKGEIKTSRNYLENYLGISKNMPYNQEFLSRIPDRLRELPFVQVIKPYEIGMRPGKADVYLYLNNKKASNLNGVLGILPDDLTGEVLITGDVDINLMNALRQGETINFRWQRLQTRTQQLDVRFAYPYILNTPLGTEVKMNLYRQDTLFSTVNLQAAVQYFIKGINYVKVFVEQAQSNVISAQFFSADRYVDSRMTLFGIGANTGNLNYRFNPRSGYFLETTLAAGTKKISRNPEVDESFYEDIKLTSEIYNLNLRVGNYFPLGRRSTVLLRVNGGHFINDNMFRNEMYRLGGLKSIRGFDEQSIFASGFAIGTLEYRFLLDQNSNIFAFFDQGIYENRVTESTTTDTPFGFGAGISFETGAGVFSLTYALGRQFDNNISVRGGKLHFGFISFF